MHAISSAILLFHFLLIPHPIFAICAISNEIDNSRNSMLFLGKGLTCVHAISRAILLFHFLLIPHAIFAISNEIA